MDVIIILGLLLVFGAIIFFGAVRVVQEYERGVIFRLGRVVGAKGPGLFLIIPFIDKMVKIDLRTVTLDVPAQEAITADNVTAVRMRELQRQSEEWLRKNTPETMWTTAASTNLMFSHISERNIKSSIMGALIALFLIAAVLAISFRSVKFGLISIIPNLAPALMAFGIWGIAVGRIDVGNAVVLTMALGIIVDDSVHFLSKYLRARRESQMSSEEAVRYAFSTVGSALVVTSFILVAGFLVLTLSPFGLNAGMGMLTAIVLLVALGADLLFLPPMLMQIEGENR